ncbi:MAG: DUF4423 domain-containing protein [Myxococcota bacterium]
MDHDTVACEILRALRGRRSQVAFSRRLGYRSNVAHTWESGRRFPTGAVTFAAAERLGVPLARGLARFSRTLEGPPTTPAAVTALLRDLRRDLPVAEIAERAGRSRFQVSRWLSGRAEPRLPDLLRLVDATTGRLLDFVDVLVDPAALPSLAEGWARLQAARSLFWRYPHAQLVLLGLELAPYRALPAHDDAWLAARLDLPLYDVVSALERLAATGQIERDGAHWVPAAVHTVDTRRNPQAGCELKRWWAGAALQRLDADGAGVSSNAFTVREPVLAQSVELHRSTCRAMRALLAEAPGGDRLVLVQHHILPLDHVDSLVD